MIQGVIERYEDDQLVVAISDLGVVRGALTDLPVGEQDMDPSPELGLVAAKIQPGRCDVRQALACICEEPGGEIRRFVKPDR